MSKYKVGDKVLLEGEIVEIDKEIAVPYKVEFLDGGYGWFSKNHLFNMPKTYEDGLADAWELALKVSAIPAKGGIPHDDCIEMFGTICGAEIMRDNTYQEALAKIEAYEKSQQIQVGDEIAVVGNAIKGYVIDKSKECEDCYVVLITNYKDLHTAIYNKTVIEKTGRHIDIEHLLEQIRGNE